MEQLQDKIMPPSIPARIQGSTSSDVYEDTDEMEVSRYHNNFGSQPRILSDTSEGDVYEDTDDVPLVMVKGSQPKQDDHKETFKDSMNNNNKPSYINAKKGLGVINESGKRTTIHPPARQGTNSVLYENMDRTRLYYALYDCKSVEEEELAFSKGDVIFVRHKDNDAWWTGQLQGKTGEVPHNYLSPVYETVAIRYN